MINTYKNWRETKVGDDHQIIQMSQRLYEEDPSPHHPGAEQTKHTLSVLRQSPQRGMCLVLDLGGQIQGYCFLISFWSNELSGEIYTIDELYINKEVRNKGHASDLIQLLKTQTWRRLKNIRALDLEVTPKNTRALEFYGRFEFLPAKNSHLRYIFPKH